MRQPKYQEHYVTHNYDVGAFEKTLHKGTRAYLKRLGISDPDAWLRELDRLALASRAPRG